MRLASADKVILTMGVIRNEGSLANATQALELSFTAMEGLLETSFSAQSRTDFFDVTEGELSYRLTNMLVDPDTVVVRRSLNSDQLVLPTDGEVVPPAEYILDAKRGVVHMRYRSQAGASLLSVQYESGLSEGDEEGVLVAPQWLRDCAVATAVHVLNVFPSSPANRKAATIEAVSTEIRLIASQLVNSFKRPRLTVGFPVASLLDE